MARRRVPPEPSRQSVHSHKGVCLHRYVNPCLRAHIKSIWCMDEACMLGA
jgi:hypothetical protein